MSRIGKLPVVVPPSVQAEIDGRKLKISGTKGSLELTVSRRLELTQVADTLVLTPKTDTTAARERWGLTRTLIANMVKGVEEGFAKQLEINGVGYRAQVAGDKLTLSLGYSHPIEYQLPPGIEAKVEVNLITISGIDKQAVGQVSAEIRAFRPPEPYKGKGIKYSDEIIRRKAGKAAAKVGG